MKMGSFRLTIRNVNKGKIPLKGARQYCFRLTIRNVNEMVGTSFVYSHSCFRLTIRNVNLEYKWMI